LPKKPDPTLLLEVKPSRRLNQLLVVMHALALASSLANALPIAVKLILLTGICLHFRFIVKRLKNERYKIKHSEALGWEISGRYDFEPVQILNSTVITTFAIFLHFNNTALRQSLLIMHDALSEDEYRHLIVRLKTAHKVEERY
jgi:toxin CptA